MSLQPRTEETPTGEHVAKRSLGTGVSSVRVAHIPGEDMTTAMAKALIEGLEGEGVEQIWSKLNRRNLTDYVQEQAPAGMLFYIDPKSFVKKKKRAKRRRPKGGCSNVAQLPLFSRLQGR